MKKYLFSLFKLVAALIIVLYAKSCITPYYYGDTKFYLKYVYYKNNFSIQEYNTVFFGSSRIYRQLNPIYFDELLTTEGTRSFNFATGGTYNPESYYLIEQFLESDKSNGLRYAFIEIQSLTKFNKNNNYSSTKGSYWNTIRILAYSFKYMMKDDSYNSFDYLLYLISHFNRLIDFDIYKKIHSVSKKTVVNNSGHYSLEYEMSSQNALTLKKRNYQFHSDTLAIQDRIVASINANEFSSIKPNIHHIKFLRNIKAKAEKKGINLFFIVPPRLSLEQYADIIPITKHLSTNEVIELHDYNKYKEFYLTKNSFDIGHLNNNGTKIFTEEVAKNLKKYILMNEDKKN